MNKKRDEQIIIGLDAVTLRFGDMEPVVIPRARIATRLRLLDCVYRLTGWAGMNARRLRAFIAAVSNHHGWALPEPGADPLLVEDAAARDFQLSAAAPAKESGPAGFHAMAESAASICQLQR